MLRLGVYIVFLLIPFRLAGQSKPKTILWEVRSENVPYVSYLLGTFHEVQPDFIHSLPATTQKLKNAEVLFIEKSADNQLDVSSGTSYATWNREKWQQLLTQQQQQRMSAFVTKAEDDSYYKLPPLVLTLTLARLYIQNFCDTLHRASYELMDHRIEKLGKATGIPVVSLDKEHALILKEGSESRDSVQNSGYVAACVTLMDLMLRDDATDCEVLNRYLEFDIDYALELESPPGSDALQLTERNLLWLPKLHEAFQKKNCFVAVGYGHLRYSSGLLMQLKRLGYSVSPISAR
ncbi:TraB/GumN family protein [Arundinibacter roseus]|uniref:TraB/GumN family protein n=1 Tax=Arundinibacter roseus TaxID=2070510 RepID=A0A4R4KH37_9BACT|nr:TraB/GumN family protein [Arundinibacter roseus]TDB67380.1 hypothetical protein EZE20_05375 [Arundinibacter roseus]